MPNENDDGSHYEIETMSTFIELYVGFRADARDEYKSFRFHPTRSLLHTRE